MPRLKLIMNPASDRGQTARIGEALQALLQERAAIASEKGQRYEMDWVLTDYPRHATELARQAAEEGFDIIVAVGGDGTIHEVINGLMAIDAGKRPALGIIPVGTGNDFVHNLGLSVDKAESARRLFAEKTRTIDVGLISDCKGRQEYWNNSVGIGFTGAVSIATRKLTKVRGFLVYFIAVLETILFKPPSIRARIQIDDQPASDRSISVISLCNGPREGGGFPTGPGAVMDDGYITCMIMRGMSRLRMLYFLPIVMKGKHLAYKQSFEESTIRQIHIEADRTLPIHIDGEIFGPWEADIRQVEANIIPAAIKVLCG
ncbi:MAG: diacylglycerol kinase family lipid kinase [Anaerolineae bacterium]|nr:diacylglycerol kinase family lipid kinase [Anaerolineae bacterium]